ncbi:MAG TPA: hypothetical protein VH061_16025, partial [Solirubrobacteraceae bacterium]|nr:hypothetical protein [Solirubrobacteraceae bacterium]
MAAGADGDAGGAQGVEEARGADSDPTHGEREHDGGTPTPRVEPLDFSQPTKFTPEIRRRVAAALDAFCEDLALELTTELKTEVEMTVESLTQQTWAAARAPLPTNAVSVAVQEGSPHRHMLLSVELPFVLRALEALLGGKAADAPAERHLTDVDWALSHELFDGIVARLSTAWREIDGPALTRGETDIEGDA